MSADLISLHTDLIFDIAKIIDDYYKLYIYQISRECLSHYDKYLDFIVVGDSEEFVKYVHPNGSIINPEKGVIEYSKEAMISEYNPETYAYTKDEHKEDMKQNIWNLYYSWPNSLWSLPENIIPDKIIIKCIGQAIGDYQNGEVISFTYYYDY